MHITAMNVAIIRMGGYVNINDPITELDWDNWHYVERNNKTDDFRKCRRDLEELRKYVHRRRRQNTPRHGSRSRDDDETEEPPQRPEELGEEEWPENVREERRDTLPEAFEGEPEQAGGETENMQKEKNLRASWKDRSLSIVAQTTQSRDIASQFMTEEYLEWPAIDWTSSHDRAQLSAYMKIYEYGKRQAKTIGDGYNRLAEWCAQQCDIHRAYARVGSLSLDIQHVF
jgi:hypothetical protein